MMDDLPNPLVGQDVDCRDLDSFMLNVERLMSSELVALSSHEVIGAALLLWCRAWKQYPAASLPDDERVLAAFARLSVARFRKLRDEVLRGFVLCSDGRLYHKTLSNEAIRASAKSSAFLRKRETDAERLRKWREKKSETRSETPDETRSETRSETRFVAEGTGRDDTGRDDTGRDDTGRDDTGRHLNQSGIRAESCTDGARGQANIDSAPGKNITAAGAVCLAIRSVGIPITNPSHPTLLALIDAGAGVDEFRGAARDAVRSGKSSFAYVLGTVRKRREEAASMTLHKGRMPTKQESLEQSNRAAVSEWLPPELREGTA